MKTTHDATKEMVAELRRMANRTGNKQAEQVMRDGAAWLEDVEGNRVELQNEVEKLRQQLADKDEQLAGWKALLDAKMAIDSSTDTATGKAKRKSPRPSYDYAGTLTAFYASGDKTKLIPVQITEHSKKHPAAWRFREKAVKLSLPVMANIAGNYVLLTRTDITGEDSAE